MYWALYSSRLHVLAGSKQGFGRCVASAAVAEKRIAGTPTLHIPAKGAQVYSISGNLASKLQKSSDVNASATGSRAALLLLQTCALAEQELKASSNYLPNFGRLALRLRSCAASSGSEKFVATVSRLLDLPLPSGDAHIVRRSSHPEELGQSIADHFLDQTTSAAAVGLKLVGDSAAHRAICAVWWAQKVLTEHKAQGVEVPRIIIIPELGAALTPEKLVDHTELRLSVAKWTRRAVPLPPPPIALQKKAQRLVPTWPLPA